MFILIKKMCVSYFKIRAVCVNDKSHNLATPVVYYYLVPFFLRFFSNGQLQGTHNDFIPVASYVLYQNIKFSVNV